MTSSRKIVIVGAGMFSIPLIQKAKEMGHYVIAIHHKENDLGSKYADKNFICDANDIQRLLKLCNEEKPDGIATISEYAALSVSYIAEKLGLPGYSYHAAKILSNKFLLRELQKDLNIPQPGFGLARNKEEAREIFNKLKKPVMVKPVNSCGSRGVFKADNWQEIESRLEKSEQENFQESGLIIEEFMEGIELGGGVIFRDSGVFVFGITRKYVNEFFIPYLNILPSEIENREREKIISCLNSIASELKIGDTYLNVNMILTKEGPRILELGGRLSGNSSPEITKLVYGVDPYEYVINYSLGIKANYSIRQSPYFFSAYIIGSRKEGKVKKINAFENVFPEKKDSLIKSFFKCKIGDFVQEMKTTESISGFFILKEKTFNDMTELIRKVHMVDWIETEKLS
jgi:biotin carboxylase